MARFRPEALEASRRHLFLAVGLLLTAFVLLQGFNRLGRRVQGAPRKADLRAFPGQVGKWRAVADLEVREDVLSVLGLDDYLMREYRHEAGGTALFYVGYIGGWSVERRRRTVHSPQFCYEASGWEIVSKEVLGIGMSEGEQVPVTAMLVQKGGERQWVIYWFQWGGRVVAEEEVWSYGQKVALILDLLSGLARGERTDRALVRVSARVIGAAEETLKRQMDFIRAAFPLLPLREQGFSSEGISRAERRVRG
jgi:EpsI family protein